MGSASERDELKMNDGEQQELFLFDSSETIPTNFVISAVSGSECSHILPKLGVNLSCRFSPVSSPNEFEIGKVGKTYANKKILFHYYHQPDSPRISTGEENEIHHGREVELGEAFEEEKRRLLASGWFYKKGSGKDVFMSRRWKSRYAELHVSFIEQM